MSHDSREADGALVYALKLALKLGLGVLALYVVLRLLLMMGGSFGHGFMQ